MATRSSGKRAPRRTPSVDSRQQLIDTALEIILKEGIDALRIEVVCERVGVTKGSLYWHFQDRQGLIREALFEQLRRLSAEQIESLDKAIDSGASREEYLLRVAGTLVDPFDTNESEARWQRWEMLATARRDPELRKMMADLQRAHQRYLVDIALKAQQRGILRRDVDPSAVAAAITAIALGSNNLSYLDADGPTPEAWNGLLLVMIDMLFPPS
ncbi:MAG: TetR/AcrR family transcriptional regulator [Acidimicrobiia bacterium]|nr:TetR/AcrR family transcriptional regulator [Acidimicrobiia bacterium]